MLGKEWGQEVPDSATLSNELPAHHTTVIPLKGFHMATCRGDWKTKSTPGLKFQTVPLGEAVGPTHGAARPRRCLVPRVRAQPVPAAAPHRLQTQK